MPFKWFLIIVLDTPGPVHEFQKVCTFGCKEQRWQLEKEICLIWGLSVGVGGLSPGHVQAQSDLSEFPLVLSFSLRLMASSENIMVSGGRKEATCVWFPLRGPLSGCFLCLIGQDWVTCPFPVPSLDGSPGDGNGIDYGWFRPIRCRNRCWEVDHCRHCPSQANRCHFFVFSITFLFNYTLSRKFGNHKNV